MTENMGNVLTAPTKGNGREPGALVSFLRDYRPATVADVLAWEAAAESIHTGPLAPAS